MLLSHLIHSSDPLLVLLVQGRLDTGDSIRLDMKMMSGRFGLPVKEPGWGPLKSVKTKQFAVGDSYVILTWKDGGEVGTTVSSSVSIEAFCNYFELKKDPTQMADWVLTNVKQKVTENLSDEEEPLLVTLIDQCLQAGERVIINIEGKLPQFDGTVIKYKHSGLLRGISELKMKSPAQRKLAGGDRGVSITFEKAGASVEQGYKGWTEVVLPVHNFDELYTLKKVKSFGHEAWMMVNA